jgi:hypothetical protein
MKLGSPLLVKTAVLVASYCFSLPFDGRKVDLSLLVTAMFITLGVGESRSSLLGKLDSQDQMLESITIHLLASLRSICSLLE